MMKKFAIGKRFVMALASANAFYFLFLGNAVNKFLSGTHKV